MSGGRSLGLTRRGLLAAAAATGVAVRAAAAEEAKADFLFVQTADGLTFDPATMTLRLTGASSVTTFFSDRPERIAGNMRTADFVPFWSEGSDSFLSDPPNADVSVLEGNALVQSVVVLRDPRLDGADLLYTVEIVEGEPPRTGRDASVFIDVIGMPLTPLSFAGGARRMRRRAIIYR